MLSWATAPFLLKSFQPRSLEAPSPGAAEAWDLGRGAGGGKCGHSLWLRRAHLWLCAVPLPAVVLRHGPPTSPIIFSFHPRGGGRCPPLTGEEMGAQRGSETCSRPCRRGSRAGHLTRFLWFPAVLWVPEPPRACAATGHSHPLQEGHSGQRPLHAEATYRRQGRQASLLWSSRAGPPCGSGIDTLTDRCRGGHTTPPEVRPQTWALGTRQGDECTGTLTTTHRISSSLVAVEVF